MNLELLGPEPTTPTISDLHWETHAILRPPTAEQLRMVGPEEAVRMYNNYHAAIRMERDDPYRHGIELPQWAVADGILADPNIYELWIFGGNRSGKSRYACLRILKALMENPGSTIMCWSQDHDSSVRDQQSVMWSVMPKEFRTGNIREQYAKIVWTPRGFTDNFFQLPNKSRCYFHNYQQFAQNPNKIEGAELGAPPFAQHNYFNLANWFDEYLGGPDLMEKMRARLWTRNAKSIVSVTFKQGYNDTARAMLQGARTLETRRGQLLDEELPFLQQPLLSTAKILYFWTENNPYNPKDRLEAEAATMSRELKLRDFYGIPTKADGLMFPRFRRSVNVLQSHDDLPFIKQPQTPGSRYLIVDPADTKPWSMIWVFVDPAGTHWVYREWPGVEYGAWGDYTKGGKTKPGPAQDPLGYSVQEMVDLIRELEGDEIIEGRYIDPNLAVSHYMTRDSGTTSIYDQAAECGMDFILAPDVLIKHGTTALNTLFAWDPDKTPSSDNHPHLYFSPECEQTLTCVENWTEQEGRFNAFKDFVDCLRYMAVAELQHIPPGDRRVSRRGRGGY